MLPTILLAAGLAVLTLVVLARYLEAVSWRRSLTAFRLFPPSRLSAGDVARWLSSIAAATHPTRLGLLPLPPMAVETVSDASGIAFYVLAAKAAQARLLASVRAGLPGARLAEAPEYLTGRRSFRVAAEWAMTSRVRPLGFERAEGTNAALLAALQPVARGCAVVCQYILTSAGTPAPVHSASADLEDRWWASYLVEGEPSADADTVRAARRKQAEPLLRGVGRIGVVAPDQASARALLGRVWSTMHALNAPGVRLLRRRLPSRLVAERMSVRAYPLLTWLAAAGDVELSGHGYPTAGTVHRGPAAAQDIHAGRGVVAFDLKGSLVTDVLSQVDERHAEQVVVLDAGQRERVIGFNVIGHAGDEASRELQVDNLLHVFKTLWADFWGPRSDSILRASLATLVHTHGVDGSAMTVCELVPLLSEPAFRRFLLAQPGVPEMTRVFWQRYDAMPEGSRQQAVAPVINKVEAFTSRVPIRLLLGQSAGFRFADVFRPRKPLALLISLAKGTIGEETACLLGALLVSSLWQAAMARASVSEDKHRPVFAVIDEAQDIVRLPVPIKDVLSQARGFKLGLTLANQYFAQLPKDVQNAMLGTVRTQACFAVEHSDAVLLAKRFAPLTADELTSLGRFEIALRPCVGGVTQPPVTGTTLPLEAPLSDPAELAKRSRERYGVSRTDVEHALKARVGTTVPHPRQPGERLGRIRREQTP